MHSDVITVLKEFFCLDLDSLERSLATIPLHTQIGENGNK